MTRPYVTSATRSCPTSWTTTNTVRQGAAGNFAIHYYPLRILRFELLATVGNHSNQPLYATRPVAILDLGWLKLKAGTEYQHQHDPTQSDNLSYTTKKGVGGAIQFIFQPHVEFGLNAAQGTVKSVNATGDWQGTNQSFTRTSFGGFANVSNGDPRHPLIFGVGGVYTHTEDQHNILGNGVVDKYWLMQSFMAVQYVAFQQLYIKLVAVYARGHWLTAGNDPPITFDDDMYSIRLRFAFYY